MEEKDDINLDDIDNQNTDLDDDSVKTTPLMSFDPIAMETYWEDIKFPISQDDLMIFVRSKNPPQEMIEQMETMLQSDMYYSSEQIANELGGFYNDGEAVSQDGEDFERA